MERKPGSPEGKKRETLRIESGSTAELQDYADGYVKSVEADLQYMREYNETYPEGHEMNWKVSYSGYTEKTPKELKKFLDRLVELGEKFHVTCEVEIPNWANEKPVEAVAGMSLMGHDSMVKVKFTFNDSGVQTMKEFDVLIVPDDEDDFIHYKTPIPFPSNKMDDSAFGLEGGWDDNDVKNEIAQLTFRDAMRKLEKEHFPD